jgi:aldehyde:ferredoxin oxidoreductase
MTYGYHGAVLHVNLSTGTTHIEHPDDNFYRIYAGGALMGTYYLLTHTAPGIDSLDPANVLVFNNSVAAGYPAAGLVRYIVTTKSPLTNGIGETRAEGRFAVSLKQSGYDAIVIHGAAKQPTGLLIENGVVSLFDARAEWGSSVGACTDTLEARFGHDIDVAAIGPAGEHQVRYANIISSRTHQAQRHGVGAVMGSKKLKAIVIKGGALPPVAHPDTLAQLNHKFAQDIQHNTLSRWQLDLPGFAVWIHTHGLDTAIDAYNFSKASFEHLDAYAAPQWMPHYKGVSPCPGCVNDCMKIYQGNDADLDVRASAIHQEISGSLGPNIGTSDAQMVMRLNNLCNQLGLDPVSLGFTLSFAMEANQRGLIDTTRFGSVDLQFGDHAAIERMIRQISTRTGFGAVLAEGCKRAADQIGNGSAALAMHVKGLEMVPIEPRSQTNLALGFATAPIGPRYDICEHDWDFDTEVGWEHSLEFSRTLGIIERVAMEDKSAKKVRNYKALNNLWSAADALGFCIFAIAPTRAISLQMMTDMLAAITGWETSSHELLRFGERRNHIMRIYNAREGLTRADDTLPERFFTEPITSGPKQGRLLDKAAFHANIDLYFDMMGWDEQGVPRAGTRYDHHLEWTLTT